MPYIETTDKVAIHYEDVGSGPPLVLIHGWAMSERVWSFQTESLSASHRLISLDLRGHGRSSPGVGCALSALADDVATVCENLDLTATTLLGWSLGAQVALSVVARIRARLSALILVGGTPMFTATDDYPHALPATEARGMGVRLKRDYEKTMGEFFRGMFADGEVSPEQNQRIVHSVLMGGRLPDRETARGCLETLVKGDLRPLLSDIDLPTLLVHGSADTICPPAASSFMAKALPDAELHIMEGLGHAPFLSHPDEFDALLGKFLKRIYGGN